MVVAAVFVFPQFKNIIRLIYIYIFHIYFFCCQNWKKYSRSQERMVSETQRSFPFKNREARARLDFSF